MFKKWDGPRGGEQLLLTPLGEVKENTAVTAALARATAEGWQGVWLAAQAGGGWRGATLPALQAACQQGLTDWAAVTIPLLPLPPTPKFTELVGLFEPADSGLGVVLEQGKPRGLLKLTAVSEWLRQSLAIREGQLEAVLATAHEAITIIDQEDRVVGWNRAAQEMYQISAREIMDQKIGDYFTALVVTDVVNKLEVRDAYHQPCAGTHVLINASPIKLGETIIGSVSAERDITETVYLHQELSKASSQVRQLEQEISKINSKKEAFTKIYGHSRKLTSVINLAKKVANTNAAVLIRGESGTGKELFAEAIHQESGRHEEPFVIINCGAIPPSLFESELFGYQPGAFTGADKKGRLGKFELAHRGTIFLDEIGELSPELQVKLLRVLQDKRFYRVGGGEPVDVDVRVIAATHRDLEKMIVTGAFREDLYYRINVVSLSIPALRERRDDIPELLYLFIREFCHQHQRDLVQMDGEVMDLLINYAWPGNIRELRNVVERMVVLADEEVIGVSLLPETIRQAQYRAVNRSASNLAEMTEETERQIILDALRETKGNRSQAARQLGIPRSTLYYKLKTLDIR